MHLVPRQRMRGPAQVENPNHAARIAQHYLHTSKQPSVPAFQAVLQPVSIQKISWEGFIVVLSLLIVESPGDLGSPQAHRATLAGTHCACGVQSAHTWLALPGHSAAACTAQSVRSTAEQAAERVSHARADASCALPRGVQQVEGMRKPARAVGAYTDCWSSSARHSPSKQTA